MDESPKPSRRLVSPAALAFFREGRHTPGYSLFDWLHGYIYGRWPYLYISIGVGEHPLSKKIAPLRNFLGRLITAQAGKESSQEADANLSFAETYHGKVVPLSAARQLVSVQEDVRITNLETIIPYATARDIILQDPEHIIALECPCRSARLDPCLPLDVCLVVGEPFASFVMEHHSQRARWISSAEAVEILKAEDKRGHVHHAFFKDAMLGRFYAICNCCACCCGAMQAQRNGVPMLAASGYTCQVDESLCIGCGDCQEYCQFEALSTVEFHNHVDGEKCMGCGVCVNHCEQEALSLVRAPEKGEPLQIFELLQGIQQETG